MDKDGLPRLEGREMLRLESEDEPRFEGEGEPRLEGEDEPRLEGVEIPRLEGHGLPRLEGMEIPRLEGHGLPRLEGRGMHERSVNRNTTTGLRNLERTLRSPRNRKRRNYSTDSDSSARSGVDYERTRRSRKRSRGRRERSRRVEHNSDSSSTHTTNVIPSEDLTVIRQSASENIKTQQLKDIERFNSHRKSSKRYEAGDLVRVERQVPHDGKSHKLVVKFQGPYRVIKVLPNERYVIEDTPMTRKHGRRYEAVVAVDKIQPWLSFSRDFESSDDEIDHGSNNEN
ncbi:hypothetical protein HF086_016263 [Spodoptera exigua]|uniref:Uncharacterized protein n=1 Tax=Spodoptera exigua TaxID=7107 RepID=A0A922MXR4_SPOEX|nr:hypothetical protein HF086_016263 [Spodoptera exigua]